MFQHFFRQNAVISRIKRYFFYLTNQNYSLKASKAGDGFPSDCQVLSE
jgi:hypothetical protein